ncbi:MliC family protein [Shewanella schlegeliana]|uniref:MliC family protein n=1 Tax=Shewanella schlegeliana TaxID=190308 RepID=A0ABS1T176_9GAMM|nr:MliC family protein [Shewanella schlegeliana]MBL4914548.1 MliC family protein [Shewanella schlegeliana]MCL1109636.1 MliC family protein [Shewanella schlegeliana]GIU30030.1 hypothetical protein TUM4433_20020 [Shewanella schlegeliana]
MQKYIMASCLVLLTACSAVDKQKVVEQQATATKQSQVTEPALPSFDCTKAQGQVETLICHDVELAQLDRQMEQVFKAAVVNIPAAEQPKVTQRGWIKGRNDCWKAQDVRECTLYSYQSRMIELQIQGGLLEVPPAVVFDCGEHPQITAVFYTQLDPVTAVFTFSSEKMGEQQLQATNVRSGSGAKYQGRNFEFWEHQGEASVQFFDEHYMCQLRK